MSYDSSMSHDELFSAYADDTAVHVAAALKAANLVLDQVSPSTTVGELSELLWIVTRDSLSMIAAIARDFCDAVVFPEGAPVDAFLAIPDQWRFEAALQAKGVDLSTPVGRRKVLGRVANLAEASGRNTVMHYIDKAREAGKSVSYARVPTGRETCGFCIMLAGRGAAYKTAKSAGKAALGASFHDRCDCKVVPVVDDADTFPGSDILARSEKLWFEVTEGYSGAEARREFDRWVRANPVEAKRRIANG